MKNLLLWPIQFSSGHNAVPGDATTATVVSSAVVVAASAAAAFTAVAAVWKLIFIWILSKSKRPKPDYPQNWNHKLRRN